MNCVVRATPSSKSLNLQYNSNESEYPTYGTCCVSELKKIVRSASLCCPTFAGHCLLQCASEYKNPKYQALIQTPFTRKVTEIGMQMLFRMVRSLELIFSRAAFCIILVLFSDFCTRMSTPCSPSWQPFGSSRWQGARPASNSSPWPWNLCKPADMRYV